MVRVMASENSPQHFKHRFHVDGTIEYGECAFTERLSQRAGAFLRRSLWRSNDNRVRGTIHPPEHLQNARSGRRTMVCLWCGTWRGHGACLCAGGPLRYPAEGFRDPPPRYAP